MILENLPPEQYEKTEIMTEDPFFDKLIDRITNEPNPKTLFAILHRRGVITREDICCIMHPLSSDSAQIFNLIEVLKRKPNCRTAIETAVRDCLQDELLSGEPVETARLNQENALCFGDLLKLEHFFESEDSSNSENLTGKRWSCLHHAAADGDLSLYTQLESLFLGEIEDQEKYTYIQRHRDEKKNTVLHGAVEYGNDEGCGYLCRQYPQLTKSRNVLHQEPIHLAIAKNKTDTNCLKQLMETNIRTDQRAGNVIDEVAAESIQRLLLLTYTCDNVAVMNLCHGFMPSRACKLFGPERRYE
ncbi:uncharacterized protein LOC110453552 [Mizuhopecten yessoensis]|uniref:uncharacterized protein LOC110453552 n=1 Tax=Mizuhopecten yessoensis TaxID=6573 RepID=UPI000B45C26B|nr:uncharacterized protein LOC110453552 [Mizuhopecten yessoensis]